jgi:hypothetical protein
LAAVLVCGCAFAQVDYQNNKPKYPPIQWSTFKQSVDCKITQKTTRLIRTPNEWDQCYRELIGARAGDKIDLPKDVDWIKQGLILITMGAQQTEGYKIFVESVTWTDPSTFTVGVVNETPPRGAKPKKVSTSPYVVIRYAKTAGNVKFVYRTQEARVNIILFDNPPVYWGCGCCPRCECMPGMFCRFCGCGCSSRIRFSPNGDSGCTDHHNDPPQWWNESGNRRSRD